MPTVTTPAITPSRSQPSFSTAFDPIAADLAEMERRFDTALAPYLSSFAPLLQHLHHYRGKRLRPTLLLLTATACGRVTPAHHTLAAVVEMIHTATLVHDDVLDDASIRRHVSTVNAEWGNKVSILLGDLLFTNAFHLSSTVDVRACSLIGEATNRVCAGELKQVCERGNLHLSEADYFRIVDGKTAALTEACGRLGAIYAGADEDVVDQLGRFGRDLGIAFQIADDLLDLLGNETTTGKTLGTDLEQQKLTLPIIHALHTLLEGEADELRAELRSPGDDQRTRVLELLSRSESVSYAKRRAEEFAHSAREALNVLPPSPCRSILEQLTVWSIRREK